MNPPPAPQPPVKPTGLWRKIYQAHFHDYTPPALRMWLAIVAAGALALVGSLANAFGPAAVSPLALLVGLALVAVAAWFPIEIPRSKYSLGGADAFVFAMLAVIGMPAAVLAAGLEGAIGAMRSTRRWTSRISTPAGNMAAMWVGGSLFELAWPLLTQLGWSPALAKLAALPVVAVVPFTLASLALMSTITLKRGQWPNVCDWLVGSSWMIALNLGSGLLAGMVQLGAAGQGPVGVAIVGVGTLAVLALLSISLARIEAAHQAQEGRIQSAQHESELNQQRFAIAFANAAVGMAIVDSNDRIVRANLAFCALLDQPERELVGVELRSLVHPDDRLAFDRDLNTDHPTIAGAPLGLELRLRKSNVRELLWVALHRAQFVPANGGRGGRIYQAMDITSRRLAEQQLHHVAFHDSLTGLCNRSGFYGRVAAAVEVSRTAAEVQFAVVFIDLDRFKVVNDSLGHLAGNELLCEVGRRLTALLLPHDVIGRLGGDEFAILLYHPGDKEGCLQRAQDLLGALSPAATIRGHEVVVQASAGITFSDLGYRTVDELLRDADLAMYESKFSGRDRLSVYDRSMHERVRDKLDLEADLRHAIDEGRLSLAFQPLYVLGSNQLTGFEALARWLHPVRGPVSPAVFIELAEECGLIENLTAWALDSALAQLAQWRRDFELDLHVGVNVNISGRDMARPQFVDMVLKALRRHAIAAQQLTLEITETVLMGQVDVSSNALALLHTAGVRLAIDDFGTGYSSLAYLSKLPIDDLKIDRSFVQAMEAGPEGVEIVRAVATLGHSLRKQVVAEGIETPAQLNALQALGIDKGQGYLLGRPMSPAEVGLLLTQLKSTAPKPGNLRYVPQSRAPAAKAELQAPAA